MADALAPKVGIELSEEQKLAWLRLIRSENVGPNTFRDLINYFGSAGQALEALPELARRGGRGKKIRVASAQDAETEYAKLLALGGRLICMGEADYPPALRQVDGAPPVLSLMGSTTTLCNNCVAIVGSRNSSLSGMKLTRVLAKSVGQAGYGIVSGLARGIDTAAHEASVETGTIAVFAGGVDHIYPVENEALARRIVEQNGAVISEMPFGWRPRAQDFPRRNRIVAGIALGLVVIEAASRSGSLISARLANEMGRVVLAVPGSPLDPRSEGTNRLIREGATLIRSAEDVVEAVGPLTGSEAQVGYSLEEHEGPEVEPSSTPTDDDRQVVVGALDRTPTNVDELIRFTGLNVSQVQLVLLELDLAGQLERHPGNRVSLI